jgi:RsiW-degrading membrane proteinase PrsW (M82 family)
MTTITMDHSRLAAIEASGASVGFRFVQLRNPVFWIYIWAVVTGVARAVSFYQPGFANYGGALVGGTIAYAFYTAVWVLFLHSLDRFTPLPPRLLLVGFVWGAIVATTFLALTVNTALLTLYTKWFGGAWASDWAAGLTAPFTEETAKAIGFVILLGLAPHLFRSAFDGFVAGAFIGLGFEISEDILYVFNGAAADFGTNQASSTIQIAVARAASGAVSHAMFTAFVCAGLMWILGRDTRGRHVVKGVAMIAFAAFMHFAWDDAGAIGTTILGDKLGGLVGILLVIIGIVAVIWAGRDTAGSERGWARDLLAPETANGVITADELDALAGTHRDRRQYIKAQHGHHERTIAKHVMAAGRDLCTAIAESGGQNTPDLDHARAEITRLRNT